MTKQLVCPLCVSKKLTKFETEGQYELSKCSDCGLVWDSNFKKQNSSLYEKDYFLNENPKGGYTNYIEGMQINRKTFVDRLKRIEKKIGKEKLLDVGCALGDCLIEAKNLGWKNPQGIELSKYAQKSCKERGLNVKLGTLKSANFKPNSFDIITLQDVIEHVQNPFEELKIINRILKPGGLLFLVTPDIEGFWAKILGKYWYHYKSGEHLLYFSQQTVKKILIKTGFSNIETEKTYHIMSFEYILNRLRVYSPIFDFLLKIIRKSPLKNISFKVYTGELEAWAEKPIN